MTLAPIGAWKLTTLIIGAAAAAMFVMDPSTKVMLGAVLIASLPATISGVFSVVLQFRAERRSDAIHATLNVVKEQTDGINNRLQVANDTQAVELKKVTRRADLAQGRQDERDSSSGG